MIDRPDYLDRLRQYRDKHLIKVMTGVRRCGKTTLLELYRDWLLTQGVEPSNVQFIDFEDPDAAVEDDWRAVFATITDELSDDGMNYILLNEPQLISSFERLLNGLHTRKNVDLYVTGSNAWFLSSEMATLLSGRYVEIPVLPFSFKEYLAMRGSSSDLRKKFDEYLTWGGFPQAVELHGESETLVTDYLRSIYNTVLLKDIMGRKGIGDAAALDRLARFMFHNVGNTTTPRSIAATMTSFGQKISNHTVTSYLGTFVESYVLYPVERYDVRGKQLLQTQGKYYLVDMGLRRMLLGRPSAQDVGHLLENVIYLELIRRHCEVRIGKSNAYEIDFVATHPSGDKSYYQVAYTAREESTLERELRPLRNLDNNPKYLVTLDEEELDFDGIKKINALEFLLAGRAG
ncbi:MAG: ATP-binding protein [Propionibacteriaceae bacterium]|jgi:predicted AAA+ superfamily ATPase|nr:ATP-binding protein [Propionibacteriaceae bacterium]